QEERVGKAGVRVTVVGAPQFYDFPVMVASWTRQGDTVTLPPLLMRPVAPGEVAQTLAEVATGTPQGRIELAGPETQDLVDMARRTLAARGDLVRIIPTWDGIFGESMAGKVLLPGPGARLGVITFEDWLASGGT